jgi:hypothetical protein
MQLQSAMMKPEDQRAMRPWQQNKKMNKTVLIAYV